MPLKVKPWEEVEYRLEKSDKFYGVPDDEPTIIRVRRVSEGERSKIAARMSTVRQRVTEQGGEIEMTFNLEQIRRYTVYLLLAGCNITDEEGNPLFRFRERNGKSVLSMTEEEFYRAWGQLPPLVADEIYEKVMEANPILRGEVEGNPPA